MLNVPKSSFGIQNTERCIERVLWTSATFVSVHLISSLFFGTQSLANRTVFSVLHGGAFIYLFESIAIEDRYTKLKEIFNNEVARTLLDYTFFFLLTLTPIIFARTITTWTFQPLSFHKGLYIGLFNYLCGGMAMLIYDKFPH